MTQFLKESTAVTVIVGPFVDSLDGNTPETALTITQSEILLSKNGAAFAQKNESSNAVHRTGGEYAITLNETDTNTLGNLRIHIAEAGALLVWEDFTVLAAGVYDALILGSPLLSVNADQISGSSGAADAVENNIDRLDANISSRFEGSSYVAPNNSALTTLVDRITAERAEFLDNLVSVYQPLGWYTDDELNEIDRYTLFWMKNGAVVAVTNPTIQVIKYSDSLSLVEEEEMLQLGSEPVYYYEESVNRMVDGQTYLVKYTATIDGDTRTFYMDISRDSRSN